VLDMKGGLVQLVTALEALAALRVRPTVTPEVLVASDEEVGSVDSQPVVVERARGADRVLVLEPAQGPDGRLKTRRKGSGRFSIVVEGRAAHAGLEPEKGVSAIVELAHQVLAAAALHDPDRGVTVNVGTIEGGVGVNTVAPHARAMLDVRAWDVAEAERVTQALHGLQPFLAGAKVRVDGRFGRPPMVPTPRRLWRLAEDAAASLRLVLRSAEVGGASDGNNASQLAPTLDGLGAVGDGAHAVSEHVRLDRMAERVALLALLLAEPALG
jgi:glutamate carboxypeptidase